MSRYAFLCALGISSIYVLVGVSASSGGHMLAQAAGPAVAAEAVWITAIFAVFAAMAIARFTMSNACTRLASWYWRNRKRMFAVAVVAVLSGVFLVA